MKLTSLLAALAVTIGLSTPAFATTARPPYNPTINNCPSFAFASEWEAVNFIFDHKAETTNDISLFLSQLFSGCYVVVKASALLKTENEYLQTSKFYETPQFYTLMPRVPGEGQISFGNGVQWTKMYTRAVLYSAAE